MAITNAEIIATNCALYGVTEPVNSYAGWMRAGRKVRTGEHAVFKASIWKPSHKKSKDDSDEEVMYMHTVNCAFFTRSQTEELT